MSLKYILYYKTLKIKKPFKDVDELMGRGGRLGGVESRPFSGSRVIDSGKLSVVFSFLWGILKGKGKY